jgi:hypothetical protein
MTDRSASAASNEYIPGTDSEMLFALNNSEAWPPLGSKQNLKRRIQISPSQTSSAKLLKLPDNQRSDMSVRPKSPRQSAYSAQSLTGYTNPQYKFSGNQSAKTNQIQTTINPANSTILLVEPIEDHRKPIVFFSNEIKLARSLEPSEFGKAGIVTVRKNLSRLILIIEVEGTSDRVIAGLLDVKDIGDWKVQCRLPQTHQSTLGVIGPIGTETTEEDIKTEIMLKNPHLKITSVKRLLKGRGQAKTTSLCIQVTFQGTILPDHVLLGYQRYAVSLYIGNSWQCYNCNGYGHNAKDCRYKSRCVLCSENHTIKECPKRNTNATAKCSNCHGDHTASYGGCPYMKKAKKVERVRAEQRLPYRDAVKVVIDKSRQRTDRPTQLLVAQAEHAQQVNLG